MYLRNFVIVFLMVFMAEGGFVIAQEGEANPPVKSATAAESLDYSGAQNAEWEKTQKDLQTAKIKYDNDLKLLTDLKSKAESLENIPKTSLQEITSATAMVKKSEDNYKRLLNLYNSRYPEKGLGTGRKYQRAEEQLEGDSILGVDEKPQGVEGKLRKLNKSIKKQYQSSETVLKKKKKTQSVDQVVVESAEKSDQQKSIPQPSGEVTDKIILEK